MLRDIRAIKWGIPGVNNRVGGPGAFPGGTFTSDSGFGIGHWAKGLLGAEYEIDAKYAASVRAELLKSLGGSAASPGSTLINFGACRIQFVQSVNAGTAGNLAFLSDKANYVVTSTYASGLAVGVYLYTCAAGDYVPIVIFGDTEARCKASLTNASTAGMKIYQVSDTGGKVDGQAAATSLTGTIENEAFGKTYATLVAGALTRVHISPGIRMI